MTLPSELCQDDPTRGVAHPGMQARKPSANLGEKALLEMVASGCAASEVLDAVSRSAEEVADGSRCGIYLIDWGGRRIRSFSAPRLPAEFSISLTGLPLRHDTGPCARAACLRIPVIAADLEADPQWQGSAFGALAATHGLRSCWSTPICATGEVLGTLEIFHAKPGSPSPAQADFISRLAYIASIAIQFMQIEAELEKASAELAHMMDVVALSASIAAKVIQPLSGIVINASTGRRMLAARPANVEGAGETILRTLRDCWRASEMISRLRDILGSQGTKAFHPPGSLHRTTS